MTKLSIVQGEQRRQNKTKTQRIEPKKNKRKMTRKTVLRKQKQKQNKKRGL